MFITFTAEYVETLQNRFQRQKNNRHFLGTFRSFYQKILFI